MTYAWAITRDRVAEEDGVPAGELYNESGTVGPSNAELTYDEVINHPKRDWFQMLDDDGRICYEGYMVHDRNSDGFEPLDDFGSPNAGCTDIRYRDADGKMKSL